MSTVLVAGASGVLGGQVVRELRARGVEATVLTRSAERGRALESLGVQTVVGDALKPETLRPAFDGVNRPDFRSVLQARMELDEQEVLAGDA